MSKKSKKPVWDTKMVWNGSDIENVIDFYTAFNVPLNPIVIAIHDKIKASGVFSLDDQRTIARIVLADVSGRFYRAFADRFFNKLSKEAASTLLNANKFMRGL